MLQIVLTIAAILAYLYVAGLVFQFVAKKMFGENPPPPGSDQANTISAIAGTFWPIIILLFLIGKVVWWLGNTLNDYNDRKEAELRTKNVN